MPLGPRVFLIRVSTAFAKPSSNHISPKKRVLLGLRICYARPAGPKDVSSTLLLHQCRSPLADLLKLRFEAPKLLRAQFREHSPHLPGMFSKGGNDEILAAWGERDDANAPVFGARHPADQAFLEEAVHGDTDRTWGQIHDRAYRIDGQRSFM